MEFYGAGEGQTTAKLVGDPTGVFEVVQSGTIVPPPLRLDRAGTQVVVSWPGEHDGWILQRSSNVSESSWLNMPAPVLAEGRWWSTNSPVLSRRFYRLMLP